jgi:hypothetical protein
MRLQRAKRGCSTRSKRDRRVAIHSPHEMNSRPAQAANASTTKSFQTRVAAWRPAARQLHARKHYSGKLDLPT